MAQGVPTEESVIAEFRARYLYSRNASKIGRELNINERTARKLAEEAEADAEFAEAIRTLRVRAVDRLLGLALSVAETAHERYLDDLPMPENVAEGANVTVIDKRADDGKLVLEAAKHAANLAKFDSDSGAGGRKIDGVTITIVSTQDEPDEPESGD
ncbi:MAG TPA: hypothetical protein VGK73_25295 [Polyangiaceae bacterium]